MNRNSIVESLRTLATTYGYAFYTDDDRLLPQNVKRLPALWLAPPEFKSKQGRTHGTITYSLKVHALAEGAKLAPADHEAAWLNLENDLIKIFARLSQNERVIAVEKLSVKCNFATLSSQGEISATATVDVVTHF